MFRSSWNVEDSSSRSLLYTWDVIASRNEEETGEKQLHEEVLEEELDDKLGSCVEPYYLSEPTVKVGEEAAEERAKCRSFQRVAVAPVLSYRAEFSTISSNIALDSPEEEHCVAELND